MMSYPNASHLAETDWLESHAADPDLRIIDCRVNVGLDDSGGVHFASARADWEASHIPGATHVDFISELSNPSTELPFMLPTADVFGETMSRLGIREGVRVVTYDSLFSVFAARLWWMLRAYGFRNAAVLNGGFVKWQSEGRPLSQGPVVHAPGEFAASPDQTVFVDKDSVLAAIGDDGTTLVDARESRHYTAADPDWVDRPGHIDTAVNLPYLEVVDPQTHAYRPPDELASALENLGLSTGGRAITYCHAGVAASSVAFAMALMGHDDVTIYDGSLREWSADPTLPLCVPD